MSSCSYQSSQKMREEKVISSNKKKSKIGFYVHDVIGWRKIEEFFSFPYTWSNLSVFNRINRSLEANCIYLLAYKTPLTVL